ncbi:MAG: hypothetical protein ACXWQ6_08590 [Candidatus Limnocylindrales bacterium]
MQENAALQESVAVLKARVAELESQLADALAAHRSLEQVCDWILLIMNWIVFDDD